VTEIADRLLAYLRDKLGGGVAFEVAPARLSGGFDTTTLGFSLSGAPPGFGGGLVLRLMQAGRADQIRREAATHAALVGQGFAAPRVMVTETDQGPLGGPFMVMQRLAGDNMMAKANPVEMLRRSRELARTHVTLHRVPGEALLASARAHGLDPALFTLAGELRRLAGRIERARLTGLEDGIAWLERNRPAPAQPEVVCHGDFHPLNVVMAEGVVTGVVDWSQAISAEPAFDVAATRALLLFPSVDAPPWLGWLVAPVRRLIVRRYVEGYRAAAPLETHNLPYFEGLRILAALIFVGERRSGPRNPWSTPPVLATICRRFERLSGVRVWP
jgi:aminoglycoside phosphotransferase (APT) family kinase protein